MEPPNAHDTLFEATFSDVEHAASELRHVLPPDRVRKAHALFERQRRHGGEERVAREQALRALAHPLW